MNKRFFILLSVLFLFTSCNNISEGSQDNVNMLGIEVCDVTQYYEHIGLTSVLRLYTYKGETFTCNYKFYPNENYNCDDFTITFSDDSVLELVSKSIENKTFTVKAVNVGNSNIQMIPNKHSELKQTTLNIEVR